MTLASILVVDADARARAQIASGLREQGHAVTESTDAGSAISEARRTQPDLMVCDCALPDLAGVELLDDLRRSDDLKAMRVLMISGREASRDLVMAFESGADEFVSKPIDMPELLARVDACLRRPANLGRMRHVRAGDIVVDSLGHRIMIDGKPVGLAPREYRLLVFLLTHQERVFSREQLLAYVWDRDASVGVRTVDVHIRRLRGALEPFGSERYLQTVRGAGYRFSLKV